MFLKEVSYTHQCCIYLINIIKIVKYSITVLLSYCITEITIQNVSGYVCNHGSPSGERDTASPRGRYGERLQRDSCLKIHM